MKSISALAIVSIIAFLLAIGLVYMAVKPPKTTTTTSYIPTTETITETTFIPTTYIITTTYTYTTTYQTPPTTITYSYNLTEKIEITDYSIRYKKGHGISVDFCFVNKGFVDIYIDPKKPVILEGKGIIKNECIYYNCWEKAGSMQKSPFIILWFFILS